MDDLAYGFSEDDFRRVANAVRKTEGLPPRRDAQTRQRTETSAAPHNWIKITSTTPQTIDLTGGGTVQGFAAVWSYFDSGATGWVDGTAPQNSVWFLGANGETPTQGQRYECRCVGADVNGQTIWSTDFSDSNPVAAVTIGTPTLTNVQTTKGGTIQAYPAGVPAGYFGSAGVSGWLLYPNGTPYQGYGPFLAEQVDTEVSTGKPIWQMSYDPAIQTGSVDGSFTPDTGNQIVALTARGGGNGSAVAVTKDFIALGGGQILVGPAGNSLPGTPNAFLPGASGSDGSGTVFLQGIAIALGTGGATDDGSYWQ